MQRTVAEPLHVQTTPLAVRIIRSYQLYLLLLPTVALVFIFQYVPMYGGHHCVQELQAASRASSAATGSGLRHFIRFFESPSFWRLIRNTIFLSGYELLVGFPIPIILALMMNMVTGARFKRTVQMVTYAPALHIHRGDRGHAQRVPVQELRPGQPLHGRARGRAGVLPRQGAVVPVAVRVFGGVAERRLGHHHLPGRAQRHRPRAARGSDRGWRHPVAAGVAHRHSRHPAHHRHSAHSQRRTDHGGWDSRRRS